MKKILLLHLTIITSGANAQQTLCSQSGDNELTGVQISWTLGELFTGEFVTDGVLVTQGVQQPQISVTPLNINQGVVSFEVYPNPASDKLNLKVVKEQAELNYTLVSISGTLLQEGFLTSDQPSIDVSKYTSGTYVLQIYHNQTVQSYRITKSK